MQEIYLIKLRDDSSEKDYLRVMSYLKSNRAEILMASLRRHWIIATLNHQLAEIVRKKGPVEIVGGVTLRKREIKVIRIKKS